MGIKVFDLYVFCFLLSGYEEYGVRADRKKNAFGRLRAMNMIQDFSDRNGDIFPILDPHLQADLAYSPLGRRLFAANTSAIFDLEGGHLGCIPICVIWKWRDCKGGLFLLESFVDDDKIYESSPDSRHRLLEA